jgi:hypothetical protein
MALTKVGKEGITGVSNSSNATALYIDSSERVGVGATPNATFGSHLYAQGTPAANKPIISAYSQGNSNKAGLALFNDAGNRGIWTDSSNLLFTATYEGNSTEHMRIDSSGNLLVGTTASTPGYGNQTIGFSILPDGRFFSSMGGTFGQINRNSDGAILSFARSQTGVGQISVSSSSTSYGTSSDYRLKENVDYTWDATTRLKKLKPARFNFISDDTNTLVDGFLAHEVSSVVPEAIGGVKDAMAVETRYTADDVETQGDTPSKNVGDPKTYSSSKIDPQSIDQSKLVPLLVKTIQELEARITALEA